MGAVGDENSHSEVTAEREVKQERRTRLRRWQEEGEQRNPHVCAHTRMGASKRATESRCERS